MATLLAATAEDSAPPPGCHARPKSVGTDAALVSGAVSRLSHGMTESKNAKQRSSTKDREA